MLANSVKNHLYYIQYITTQKSHRGPEMTNDIGEAFQEYT